jgi:hypothetical protein
MVDETNLALLCPSRRVKKNTKKTAERTKSRPTKKISGKKKFSITEKTVFGRFSEGLG